MIVLVSKTIILKIVLKYKKYENRMNNVKLSSKIFLYKDQRNCRLLSASIYAPKKKLIFRIKQSLIYETHHKVEKGKVELENITIFNKCSQIVCYPTTNNFFFVSYDCLEKHFRSKSILE